MDLNIWQFQRILSQRLKAWNLVNVVIGSLLGLFGRYWRGFGSQSIGWGLINMGIATLGERSAQHRSTQVDAFLSETMAREAVRLRNILWLNAGLDALYMVAGRSLVQRSRDPEKAMRRGIGRGIMLQGFLLLVFDIYHALVVPSRQESYPESRP